LEYNCFACDVLFGFLVEKSGMSETSGFIEQYDIGPSKHNVFGERYFYNLNRDAFEKNSAHAIYESSFASRLFNEDSLNIVIGTDSGLLPSYIQKKGLPKGARYIFIEPESVLAQLLEYRALDGLDARIACISMESWAETIQRFKIVDYLYINAVQSCNAICAQDDNINEYAELSWHIAEVLSQLHWQSNMVLGCEGFMARQIDNVADNKLPAKLLANAFLGKTVILLAGGPSLDDALPWVIENRAFLVVFAVSRISRRLQQVGVEPDFIFSVDPTELSFDISKEMLNFSEHPIFIHSYHTVPTLVSQWQGMALYLGARFPWKSALNEDNLDGTGPTVTNTALSVAYRFGFKRIILAGVDLCFTKQGFTHAQGSNEHSAGPRFNLTSLQLETNGGFMAPTSCDFAQAASALALQARVISNAGCRLINCSANAAKVENIEYLPLADIAMDPELIDVPAIVSGGLAEYSQGKLYYQKTIQELKRSHFQVEAIKQLAENARQLNDEMYDGSGAIADYKDKKKLDQIERKFKRDYRLFSKLVKKFGIRSFIKLAKPFTDEEWTAEEAKQLGNIYYDAYSEGSAKLLRLIDGAIDRVEARQQENSEIPDFSLILEQSRKDRSFGRVRLWRKKYPPSAIAPEIEQVFGEFEQLFADVVNDKNTRHFARAKSHSNLLVVKQRAGLLFKHHKSEELRDLLAALDQHDDKEGVVPYRHLINGYLAEQANDPESALRAYQQIVDGGDVLLEEALIRIAGISIDHEDIHMANLSLQCLSQLNPLYLPLYAEMQRLHGDVMVAIDTYSSYVVQFPEDTLVQIKVAMLYIEFKIYDAAELMVDHILLQKPGLDIAIGLKQQLSVLKSMAS
jgi:hypothetical protein